MKFKSNLFPWMLALCLSVSFRGISQDNVRNITLSEAINLSLQNSKVLRVSRARVDQAVANSTIAKQNQLTDLKVTGAYMWLPVQPNISTSLKSGNNGGQPSEPIKVTQAAYGIANLSVPVYSGMRIQYGIRSAEFLEKAAGLNADQDKDAVILNTIDAFSNLYKARANRRVIRENLAQSRSRDTDFANLEKNGLLARNDKLKALLQTANIELTLADVENNLKVTMVT